MTDPLAIRRDELLARCAGQRVELALDLQALRAPAHTGKPFAIGTAALLGAQLLAHVRANKRLALGAVLALAFIRPARLLRVARLAASGWRMAQSGMGLLARLRR
jgi:hypothetical protein